MTVILCFHTYCYCWLNKILTFLGLIEEVCKVEADAEDPEIYDGAEKTENGSENGIPKTYYNKKMILQNTKLFLGIKFFLL